MFKQPLHTGWTTRPVSNLSNVPAACHEATPASVPGCVHTDLLRAGKIADPYVDRNEPTLRWIGQTDWRFESTFTADAKLFEHERIDLAADGLDTVATIELNGQIIAKTENMHVGYRFDVKKHLKPGENKLAITFASAENYAFAMEKRMGSLPFLNARVPFNMIRKMACNFGWDWGPELVTCGIWRGIRLEGWSLARISGIRVISVNKSASESVVDATVSIEKSNEFSSHLEHLGLGIKLIAPDGSQSGPMQWDMTTGRAIFQVASPQTWWPAGYGEQPLYTLRANLWHGDEKLNLLAKDETSKRIGLRTIELDTSPDDVGAKFVLKVNGKPIFCKGYNWIPDDCFLDRACTPERYRTRIQQAVDSNANMLRVWGGGIFETDEFYDICDELGVLVWQDFLFACAAYAEEEPFRSLVEQEVRYNVSRLSHHASLAIWNGCNENMWGYHDWGWKHSGILKGRTWGPGYYLKLLPDIVKELDPSRPYWAASPWSGDPDFESGLHPNLASHGNKHVWEAWFGENYLSYRRFEPRFCSEFGFQGPATYASIASTVPTDQLDMASASMRHRQKSVGVSDDGDRRNLRHLSQTFTLPGLDELMQLLRHPLTDNPPPMNHLLPLHAPGKSHLNFDDVHYLLSINQARALTLGVEWFRSRQPTCMGTLYWQLNDTWPGSTSWSAIDGDGRPKPLWFATRRFYAPRLLTIQPLQDKLQLCAINDTDEPWQGPATISMQPMAGKGTVIKTIELNVPPRGVQRLPLGEAPIIRPAGDECVVAQAGGERAIWFFNVDKQTTYGKPELSAEVSHAAGKTLLKLTAGTLMRDVLLQIDRLDPNATVNENLVTLLPGETFTFEIRSEMKLTKEALTSRPVLNCANYFGKK